MLSRTLMIGLCAIFFLAISVSVFGQDPKGHKPRPTTWADSCSYDADKIVCSVSESNPQAIGPLQVDNSSHVVIRVTTKSPFDDCTLGDIKTAEIKPPDPNRDDSSIANQDREWRSFT